MWFKRFTKYLLDHPRQALVFTFITTFIPVFGIAGILIASLVTLRKGIVEGALMTVAATLPYVISFYVSVNHSETIPLVVWAAVGVAVLSNLLTYVFTVMLVKRATWSSILQIGALIGVLVVSVIHLAYPDVTNWWGQQLQSYYAEAQSVIAKSAAAATSSGVVTAATNAATSVADNQLETINVTKQYATGLMIAGILFNAILQLIVARWWQAIVFAPGMLRKELHKIRLSQLAGVLFAISLVLSYLGNSVVLDIMPILYTLFGAAGLSLVHYLFGLMHSNTVWFWLSVFYVTLIFALPVSMVLIAIIALFDIWLDVRKRVKRI